MTHQQLLDAYVNAELTVIGNYSGNIEHDARKLRAKMEAYAEGHGLTLDPELFSAYIMEWS
jgi:hypothetical protein